MGLADKQKNQKGGYIFLSHSHDDIEKVRKIRNSLEKDGFEPLCFYLKCLNDDSEIEDLIKREIDAREWFIFVDSENARKSKWVTLEREYITSTNSKKIITVDINDEQSVMHAINKIIHNLRVFISCPRKNESLARRIKDKLEDKDYLVFFAPDSIPAGVPYVESVITEIKEASQKGCVLALITEEAMYSDFVLKEIVFAIRNGGNVFPVVVGDVELRDSFRFYLGGASITYLPEQPTDRDIDMMIEKMGRAILAK